MRSSLFKSDICWSCFLECCGKGICEIKCPYKCKDTLLVTDANDGSFLLKCIENEVGLYLDTIHPHYYQVQCQLFVTGEEYCDFVVWTEKDIFIQSVTRYRVLGKIIGKGDTVLLSSQSCWVDGIVN